MFGRAKLDESVTLIAAGAEIVGDLCFSHQLYLNGRVAGDVIAAEGSEATVVVSDTGSVTGNIRVPNVVVSGTVEGNIYAAGRVELAAKARVRGNVHYRLMQMQLGALVDGQLLHHDTVAHNLATTVGDSGQGSAAAGHRPLAAAESGQPALKPVASAGRSPGA